MSKDFRADEIVSAFEKQDIPAILKIIGRVTAILKKKTDFENRFRECQRMNAESDISPCGMCGMAGVEVPPPTYEFTTMKDGRCAARVTCQTCWQSSGGPAVKTASLASQSAVLHWNFVQFFYEEIERDNAARLRRELPGGKRCSKQAQAGEPTPRATL